MINIFKNIWLKIQVIQQKWRLFLLRVFGVEIDYSCLISANVVTSLGYSKGNRGKIKIRAKTQLSHGVTLECWGGNIDIGENVYFGPYAVIYGHGGVKIGKDSLIAMHCRIISSNHTISDRKTRIRSCPDIMLPVTIGEDVWLSAGVTILGGVTIGDGCVVGAGAVVTKDLPPYSIAVGVPARVIKERL
ncbi:acyltransferase [Tolypothrix sp. FACHB-123]|uniref:acyltransferase n=1 Tax=Tolypothrix sp. FACHB-123 TaxID=2692868 RepID=UPI0016873C37|nr:acyltransferase [Tolypothrix sp. FACHB-123]MBD2357547.1 acyltransferase [Tolypothrix sp. FACHB-123]